MKTKRTKVKVKIARQYLEPPVDISEEIAQKRLHDDNMRVEIEAVLKQFETVLAKRMAKHALNPAALPKDWPEFSTVFAAYANGVGDAHNLVASWLERFRVHSAEAVAFDPMLKGTNESEA